MRYLIVVIAVFCWLIVTSPAAQACSCITPGTPCESYGSASAVFVGTAIGTREAEKPKQEESNSWYLPRVVKFAVEQSYLGVAGTEIEIRTGRGGGDCGFDFKIGQRYLVYASSHQNRLVTSICSRTKSFAGASEDLAFLGNLSSAPSGATIYGDVRDSQGEKIDSTSLASNALITIEGGKVRREIRPDAQGHYRLSGLPPGKFKVTLKLPETLIADRPEREISVVDRGCAAVNYFVADNGRVSGRVVDAEDRPVARIMISLVDPAKDPRKEYVRLERTDEDGRFSFSTIPPGRYLIGVNFQQFPDPKDPTLAYPPVFYPGVVDKENAETIAVGTGEKLTDLRVRVPLRRPASVVTINVVWTDGSPVAKASLTFRDVTDAGPGSSYGETTDDQGKFTLEGFVGQKLIIEADSNRPYVPGSNAVLPIERSEPVRITLKQPTHTIRIVVPKGR